MSDLWHRMKANHVASGGTTFAASGVPHTEDHSTTRPRFKPVASTSNVLVPAHVAPPARLSADTQVAPPPTAARVLVQAVQSEKPNSTSTIVASSKAIEQGAHTALDAGRCEAEAPLPISVDPNFSKTFPKISENFSEILPEAANFFPEVLPKEIPKPVGIVLKKRKKARLTMKKALAIKNITGDNIPPPPPVRTKPNTRLQNDPFFRLLNELPAVDDEPETEQETAQIW
jgi:hypothetical protein